MTYKCLKKEILTSMSNYPTCFYSHSLYYIRFYQIVAFQITTKWKKVFLWAGSVKIVHEFRGRVCRFRGVLHEYAAAWHRLSGWLHNLGGVGAQVLGCDAQILSILHKFDPRRTAFVECCTSRTRDAYMVN